jgi:phosphatidylserine decarboxylase
MMKDIRGSDIKIIQIAGLMVRRISYTDNTGKSVMKGQKLGFIKFGSRVDIEFSSLHYRLSPEIKVGQYLDGPNTIIGIPI